MMSGYDQAKLAKMKELRKQLREMMASEDPDSEMEDGEIEMLLEEASDESMEEPEGAGEDLSIREASEEEMEEPESVDEITALKREYFKPKMDKKQPGRMGAKTVIVASEPMKKPSLADAIPMPKKSRGKIA